MADVITRFKLETTQYDSKLRDAAKSLKEIGRLAEIGGKDFTNFSQKQVEAARALGNTASGANNVKDRLKDLVGAFNDTAKAYNNLSAAQQQSDFGKAMSQSLQQLQQRIKETKSELYSLGDAAGKGGSGGLFGGGKLDGMLQVLGGNLMTKAVAGVAGLGMNFVSEMSGMVKQGIELAKAGEGVRLAFERLNQPGILDNLRQATHGTVTDLELMKAAVKFNDFKLPLDELGTMLAFAQQKAKDTGQSVDYMVDSIVTGLGRKSLMILDNLGLSAAQIKEKMAETGDMTKAVGAIIREEMAKAGDYVETAADRATKANVELQNAMTRLGETFQPLTDTANSMWTSIKVGALDLLNNAVKPLIKALQEAGALGQKARGNAGYENLGGDAKVNRLIANLGDGKSPKAYRTYKAQMAEFDRYANSLKFKIAAFGDDKSGIAQSSVAKLQTELAGVLTMRMEYDRRAQELHKKATAKNIDDNKEEEQSIDSLKKKLAELQEQRKKAIAAGDTDLSKNLLKQINQVKADIRKVLGGTTTTTTTHKPTTAEQIAFDINKAGISSAKGVDTMPSVWSMILENGKQAGIGDQGLRQVMGIALQQSDYGRDISTRWKVNKKGQLTDKNDKQERTNQEMLQGVDTMVGSLSSIVNGIENLGIELPRGLSDILGAMQTIIGIVGAIQAMQQVGTWLGLIPGKALGGMVHAAGGAVVPGNSYSGDNIFAGHAWVNAGELILSRSQQMSIAQQLQDTSMGGNIQLQAVVTGEQILLTTNNTLRRKNRGELATFR